MWEMWSYGRTPYRRTLVENVLADIEQKQLRCDVPELMPAALGALLKPDDNTLWSLVPTHRIQLAPLLTRINTLI